MKGGVSVSVVYPFLFLYISFSLMVGTVTSNVLLSGRNFSLSFEDIEANFAPSVKSSGVCGKLYIAEPLDACSPLKNKINQTDGSLPFVLIVRGGCTFEDKVRRAQIAGFKTAIVYDDADDDALVAMAGSSDGIKIHAVFIGKHSGEVLRKPRGTNVREFHGMSSRLVKAMPSLIFTSVLEDNCTSVTCAICLEDYSVGEKLRVLPCRHKFHAACVDAWLTSWRTFCPVCKRDAKTASGNLPASERTPLLSTDPASPSSSVGSSSTRYSFASSSSAIQIGNGSLRSPSVLRGHSLSGTPYMPQSYRSYRNSPSTISPSRSSVDLRNASMSQRSHASHLISGHSLGYPSLSSLNSRYISPYIPSSSNASPSFHGSSGLYPSLLHCSESAASISPFTSAHSLPGS
ncbi:hypothetical protein C5167_033551 [Papaver somniferum]|uniref:RING-type domain-containing protein n=1 Tax=Papaver somniferum TaxID=3469 RepID=A0A4Y7K6H5_PAPSO|nr:hypothetical protein C5167_033551 [Papaver somniferum]